MNEENTKAIIKRELQISALESDMQDKIVNEIYELSMNQALMLVVKELPREKLGALTNMLENGKYEEVRNEVFTNMPNANEVLPDILNNVVNKYKETLNKTV
jgi:hypothetical protein